MESPEQQNADAFEYREANHRAQERRQSFPGATAARYDRQSDRVILKMGERLELSFTPGDAQGLEDATPEQLEVIEISPSGLGIHFPQVDADLYLPALLEGLLGSRHWMAARMGAAGGSVRSDAKSSASRRNGKLGGRPRKKLTS